MSQVIVKAIRPHRQKVLTDQGEELKLQQWANKKAAESLRGAGGDASGEQFTQAREALMRQALENPDEHGLKFMGERVPFEGQRLEEELSEPDPEGEMAEIDSQFETPQTRAKLASSYADRRIRPHPSIVGEPMDGEEKERMLQHMKESSMGGSMVGTPPKTPDVFDAEGKLRQGLKPEEEDKVEEKRQHVPMDAEHPDYFKTSRQTAFRDAWSLLKSQ